MEYRDGADGITAAQLHGFFEGWPDPPDAETHLAILRGSDRVVIAMHGGEVIGFITAVTDGVLAAYIPLLEVRSGFRGRGIGAELVRRMLARLEGLYMIDVVCDPEVQGFYEKLGFTRVVGAGIRRYELQRGRATPS